MPNGSSTDDSGTCTSARDYLCTFCSNEDGSSRTFAPSASGSFPTDDGRQSIHK